MKKIISLFLIVFIFMNLCTLLIFAKELIVEEQRLMGTVYKYNGKVLTPKKLFVRLNQNDNSKNEARLAKSYQTKANIFAGITGACIGYPLGESLGGSENPKWFLLGVSAISLIPAIMFGNKASEHWKNAVELYNGNMMARNNSALTLAFNKKGMSLNYIF